MPSSTSSFDVPLREIPEVPWHRALILAALVMAVSLAIWEAGQRRAGMTTDDLDDGVGHWAVERHKIDKGDTDIAIVGSSRILFDTDLDIWQEESGYRPVQLALEGTSPRMFFEDIANDEDFTGLLVVGVTPGLYIRKRGGLFEAGLKRYRNGSPSQRLGHRLRMLLEPRFAFLDADRALFKMIERSWILPEREGVRGPYTNVWKIQWNGRDRQTFAWERLSRDEYLRQHAYQVWMGFFESGSKPLEDPVARAEAEKKRMEAFQKTIAEAAGYIEKIRARGGEVVFVRSPSSHGVREFEKKVVPREAIWDRLVAESGAIGIHFEDYPELSEGMVAIEWSHLDKPSAQRFSRGLARIVQERLAERGYVIGEGRVGKSPGVDREERAQ